MRSCCGCANAWLRSPAESERRKSRTPESVFGREQRDPRGGLTADGLPVTQRQEFFLLIARHDLQRTFRQRPLQLRRGLARAEGADPMPLYRTAPDLPRLAFRLSASPARSRRGCPFHLVTKPAELLQLFDQLSYGGDTPPLDIHLHFQHHTFRHRLIN